MRDGDVQTYLKSAGLSKQVTNYGRGATIYSQGESGTSVLYIQAGTVRLSVVSPEGREAILATLHTGDFFGEGTLSGQPVRITTARAVSECTILAIERSAMLRMLHDEHDFSDRFISYMLTRNARIESDLIDQLFNSSEKRLARALLLLTQWSGGPPELTALKVSQETLAKTIGSTRTRVNYFMNKFRKAGYVDYSGDGLKVNSSLANVLLHD